MQRFRSIVAAAFAILATGCATRPPPPITAEQANSLPPQRLAEIVLRQFAGRVRSVMRPNYVSPFLPGAPLLSLSFATAARSSDFPGICEASVITVGFADRLPDPAPGRNAPVRAQSLETRLVYKIVGDIDLAQGLSQEARDRQNRLCAAVEPVIAPEEHRLGHRQFFGFSGDLSAGLGAAILQKLLRSVGDGSHNDQQCAGTCEGAATAMFRRLSLDDLLSMRIDRAPSNATSYTVSASFLVSGTDDSVTVDRVTVDAEIDAANAWQVRRLGHATIGRSTIIRD